MNLRPLTATLGLGTVRLAVEVSQSPSAIKATRLAFVAVVVLLTLHFPVQKLTGFSLHWIALLLFLPVAALQAMPFKYGWRLFGAYLAIVGLSAAISLLQLPPKAVALGSLSFVLLPVTFFLAMQCDGQRRFRAAASANLWVALLAGAAAYYQLNYDSVLFGLYEGTKYEDLGLWGAPRAASFFYSPQVYAAYMAFSVVLHDAAFRSRRSFPGVAVIALTSFAVLSGSVSVVAGIAGYYLAKLAVRAWVARGNGMAPVFAGHVAVAVLVVGIQLSVAYAPAASLPLPDNQGSFQGETTDSQATPTERMLSAATGSGVAGAANSSRLEVWRQVVATTPVLFGHGIGSASTLVDGRDRPSTESYILSLYYQGGIVLVAAFAVLLAGLVARKPITPERVGFAAIFLIFAVVVPVYYAWALAIVWVSLFHHMTADTA